MALIHGIAGKEDTSNPSSAGFLVLSAELVASFVSGVVFVSSFAADPHLLIVSLSRCNGAMVPVLATGFDAFGVGGQMTREGVPYQFLLAVSSGKQVNESLNSSRMNNCFVRRLSFSSQGYFPTAPPTEQAGARIEYLQR